MKKSVNVLGTKYTIKMVKISECDLLRNINWCGSCYEMIKEILIGDPSEEEYFGKLSKEEKTETINQILRHEITHAFFNESGLSASANTFEGSWAKNEELIDWIAIQFPKMQKAFEEAGCL